MGVDTYTAVLSACGVSGQWQHAALIFEELEETGSALSLTWQQRQ